MSDTYSMVNQGATPQLTEQELLSMFRQMMAMRGKGPDKFEAGKLHPNHRGVQDLDYVRPAPHEYPRMMHHASLPSRIVQNRQEQEALGPQWFISPVPQPSDWRAKAAEVHTKSGYRVYTHHVEFLKSQGFVFNSLGEAAEFLDKLNAPEQEQFFAEAEEMPLPAEGEEAHKTKKSKKTAAGSED